ARALSLKTPSLARRTLGAAGALRIFLRFQIRQHHNLSGHNATMVVVMQHGAEESQIQSVIQRLNDFGFDVHRSSGVNQTVLGAIGVKPDVDVRHIKVLDGVADVYRVMEPYKFASRSWNSENTTIDVNGTIVGGDEIVMMAGPCSVESEEQVEAC